MNRFRRLKSFARYLYPHRRRILLGLASLIAVDVAQLFIPRFTGQAVNDVVSASGGHLLHFFLLILLAAVLVVFFRFGWRYLIFGVSRRIEETMRNELYTRFLSLPAGFFDRNKVGDLMAYAVNDIAAVREMAGVSFVLLTDSIAWTTLILIFMFTISRHLTLFVIIPLLSVGPVSFFFSRVIFKRFKRVQEGFSRLSEKVEEVISGIRVVKAFNQEPGEAKVFRGLNETYLRSNIAMAKAQGVYGPLVMFISGVSTVMLLIAGGKMVIENLLSIGDFVAFSMYLGMLIWPMMAVGFTVSLYQRGMASFSRIESLLNEAPEPAVVPEGAGRAAATPAGMPVPTGVGALGGIEFRNLTFAYREGAPALRNVSIRVEPGERLAVVGRTGCGKSSLVGVLTRLYNPPPGAVYMDGCDVLTIQLSELRGLIAVVPQESFLFSDVLRENIAFGKPGATQAEIERVARIAEVEGEILQFPLGYDTVVGERGVTLSGGQRQRVALARAILCAPKVLVLDDALSAVDAETERKILANLEEVLSGRTSIVITHRISAIREFHKIAVLDNGEVAEFGDHSALMARSGIYARLYQLQAMEERLFQEADALARSAS